MKRTTAICVALLLPLSGCVPQAAAPTAGPSPAAASGSRTETPITETGQPGAVYTVIAQEYVSLRTAPDTSAPRVRKLETGARVIVLSLSDEFAYVTVVETGETGYVLASYLAEGALETEPAEGMVEGGLYAAQVREYLSLRVAPDSGAQRVAKLSGGTLLRVLDESGGFARVQVASTGARGYVMAAYLVWAGDRIDETEVPGESTGPHAVICREYVSLRAAPDTAAECLARLEPGARVDVLDHDGDFARVTARDTGETGYVLTEYLTPDAGTGDSAPGDGEPGVAVLGEGVYEVRCEEYLTVRAAPSTSAEALGRLLPGEPVRIDEYIGRFARVAQTGGSLAGYVLAGYLVPARQDAGPAELEIVEPAEEYGYETMMDDIGALLAAYPGRIRLDSAGASLLGRDIPVLLLGDPGAAHHVLIQAGIHAREHMTSLLAMAQVEYCLRCPDAPYADGTAADWLEGVCVHVLPMVNPDGVTISQRAEMTDGLRAIYERDLASGYTDLPPDEYLAAWKANAAGVDINRNFDAGWDGLDGRGGPSSALYPGEAAADQPETRALADYTLRYDFDATLSYHASGSCLYWQYGGDAAVNGLSRDLARALGVCTGYPLEGADGLDAGGYKDWAMEALGIPSVTLEIGGRACPLPLVEFATIWERNRGVPAAAARWVKGV